MPEELLDVVDEKDNVTGKRTVRDCLKEGLLHRAVVVFLVDPRARIYLQKRADTKSWYPGYWSASCTGHVSSGESYVEGATRELREELGLNGLGLSQTGKFLSPKWRYGDIIEWEFDAVFEGKVRENTAMVHNDEVAEGKWVPLRVLQKMAEERSSLTPDTIMAFELHYGKRKDSR